MEMCGDIFDTMNGEGAAAFRAEGPCDAGVSLTHKGLCRSAGPHGETFGWMAPCLVFDDSRIILNGAS